MRRDFLRRKKGKNYKIISIFTFLNDFFYETAKRVCKKKV